MKSERSRVDVQVNSNFKTLFDGVKALGTIGVLVIVAVAIICGTVWSCLKLVEVFF